MIVRQATSADALRLSSLCRDVQSLHAERHPNIFKVPQDEAFAVSFFEAMLADPTARIFIAEENGEPIGYVFCKLYQRPEDPFTFATRLLMVEQISVRPAAQGNGVGAALMKQAEMVARDLGIGRIQLDSWGFNSDAHRFFEKMGFEKFNYRFWKNP